LIANGARLWRSGVTALIRRAVISGAALAGLTACGGQSFPEAICKRVNLTDNGQAVLGVEDMAYDAPSQTLYLSAYDRRTHSEGGIYRLAVESEGTDLTVTPIIENIRPHGISLTRYDQGLTLDFIDRTGDKEEMKPVIRTLSWHDETPNLFVESAAYTTAELCASNDLVRVERINPNDALIFVTQDHKACTLKAQKRENILSANQARVVTTRPIANTAETFSTGLAFANGITDSRDGRHIYVAETRAKQVTILSHDTGEVIGHVKLSGGPDNLTRESDDIYVAIIPSLIKFLGVQKNESKRIKSRFAIITPDNTATTYDVPASVISGATVAIKAGEYIWLGAGYDTAIARCQLPAPSESPS